MVEKEAAMIRLVGSFVLCLLPSPKLQLDEALPTGPFIRH